MNKNLLSRIAISVTKCRKLIPQAALYEQLAEECCELAQACLKKARKIRNENFTPVSDEELNRNIIEEYSDVSLAAATLGIKNSPVIMAKKADRWIKRNTKEEKEEVENADN